VVKVMVMDSFYTKKSRCNYLDPVEIATLVAYLKTLKAFYRRDTEALRKTHIESDLFL